MQWDNWDCLEISYHRTGCVEIPLFFRIFPRDKRPPTIQRLKSRTLPPPQPLQQIIHQTYCVLLMLRAQGDRHKTDLWSLICLAPAPPCLSPGAAPRPNEPPEGRGEDTVFRVGGVSTGMFQIDGHTYARCRPISSVSWGLRVPVTLGQN